MKASAFLVPVLAPIGILWLVVVLNDLCMGNVYTTRVAGYKRTRAHTRGDTARNHVKEKPPYQKVTIDCHSHLYMCWDTNKQEEISQVALSRWVAPAGPDSPIPRRRPATALTSGPVVCSREFKDLSVLGEVQYENEQVSPNCAQLAIPRQPPGLLNIRALLYCV